MMGEKSGPPNPPKFEHRRNGVTWTFTPEEVAQLRAEYKARGIDPKEELRKINEKYNKALNENLWGTDEN